MVKNILPYSIIFLLLAACKPTISTPQMTPEAELTQGAIISPTKVAVDTFSNASPTAAIPASPTFSSPTPNPIFTPTPASSLAVEPIIYERPGDDYEIMFSIPVDRNSIIQYESNPDSIRGPIAIAVLPDDSILIADPVSDRLLRYDQQGRLLINVELCDLGIRDVRDLRVKGSEIFLLDIGYQKFRVHLLTIFGDLISSEDIPYQFPVDPMQSTNTLEVGLTGIAIDCEGRIILEVTGGSRLLPLVDVQKQLDPTLITQGLLCNGKQFFVSRSDSRTDPRVSAGETIYQTQLTYGLGGLNFLDVLRDGSIYLVRDDVVTDQEITVDQTIHFIGVDGIVKGAARVPLSEFYYPIMRSAALSPDGEVFVLPPRKDSLDIVRLNFYSQLEPLIPGAEIPQITISNSP